MAHHIMSFKTNLIVFLSLVCLTVLTVYTAKFVDLGANGNLTLAMFIASVKVTIVMLWFMHLKYDNMINRVIIFSTIGFLALLFGISAADIFGRSWPMAQWF